MTGRRFSIGQALTAGLRLPIRYPLAVLAWGLSMMLCSAAVCAILLPMFATMPFLAEGDMAAFENQMASMYGLQAAANLLNLGQIALSIVIWTAAMRATLSEARTDRWAFLRFGMDELRVTVVMVAIAVVLYAATIVVVLLGVGFGFALYAMGEAALVIGVFLMVFVLLAGVLIAWSRLSLLAPASVLLGTFAFVEGWRLGRGQMGRLVGLNLAIGVIYFLVYAVVGAIVAAILIGGFFASGCVWPQDPQSAGEVFDAVKPMAGWIVLAFVPLTLFMGWAFAFMAGSLTSAARQLVDSAPASEPATPH